MFLWDSTFRRIILSLHRVPDGFTLFSFKDKT